jgi:hypothetical protein
MIRRLRKILSSKISEKIEGTKYEKIQGAFVQRSKVAVGSRDGTGRCFIFWKDR